MASTKELFAPALNYMKREEQDLLEELNMGTEYLNAMKKKGNVRAVSSITLQLDNLRNKIRQVRKEFKDFMTEYSYTEQDLITFNIHPATDEELARDYEKDMKETKYDTKVARGTYTKEDHDLLVEKVNDFNLENNLPLVHWD